MTFPSYSKFAIKVVFFVFFVIALTVFVEKCKSYFPIKSVKVFGVLHANPEMMQATLTPFVKKGFFAIDVDIIKERLLQSPWISNAVVRRVWPDQVIVTVTERKPIARWNHVGLLSANGEIFSPDIKSYPNELPQFIGPANQHVQMLEYHQKITQILAPLHFKIVRLEFTPDLSWHLLFDNGIKLSVSHKDILTRMTHFVKVSPKIIGDRFSEVDHIDLRYQHGLAVRWKAVT